MPRQPKWFVNLEDTPENPLTRDRILEFIVSSGWIEGHTRKRMSPLDYQQAEDYIQSIYEEICKIPEDKLIEIYRKGKGKFTNYLKALIQHQVYSSCSKTYKENKQWCQVEIPLEDSQWINLEETGTTKMLQQFPVIDRNKNMDIKDRVHFEYDGSVEIQSEINLYEDDRNFEEESWEE